MFHCSNDTAGQEDLCQEQEEITETPDRVEQSYRYQLFGT